MTTGRCQCGAVSYTVTGDPAHSALCLCGDCRKSAGAYMVGWALFEEDQVDIVGQPVAFRSSEHATREFCGICGTGLFYRNATIFPGKVDIQTATMDDPAVFPPQARIQMAEAPPWYGSLGALPAFDRFPEV